MTDEDRQKENTIDQVANAWFVCMCVLCKYLCMYVHMYVRKLF